MKIRQFRAGGFTLVEIMIVVCIIGLLSTIAAPNLVKARLNSQMGACINNLRQIDSAKQQWALEKYKSGSALPTSTSLTPYFGRGSGGTWPVCPTGNTAYVINPISTRPTCPNSGLGHVLN